MGEKKKMRLGSNTEEILNAAIFHMDNILMTEKLYSSITHFHGMVLLKKWLKHFNNTSTSRKILNHY